MGAVGKAGGWCGEAGGWCENLLGAAGRLVGAEGRWEGGAVQKALRTLKCSSKGPAHTHRAAPECDETNKK